MSQSGTTNYLWAGHFFLFEEKPIPSYDYRVGVRLLIIFLIMEGILGPRLSFSRWLGITVPNAAVRIPLLIILTFMMIRFVAKIEFSQIGLYRWKNWTKTEQWYFVQTIILANIIFAVILWEELAGVVTHQEWWGKALVIFSVQLLWGFYQELIYRGILQTELVRRWGTLAGILVANVLFTIGPLHFYHFQLALENPGHAWIFLAIFVIGLFFGVLFKRCGNLWIIGIFHGLGDWYIGGLQQVAGVNQNP